MQSEYEKGVAHHRQGKGVTSTYGTFTPEFIRGYTDEERLTRCGYTNRAWSRPGNRYISI